MAKAEKHKKNPLLEWLDEEVPAQTHGGHVAGALAKAPKVARRTRILVSNGTPSKPEPALMRESSPAKVEERHSQAHSREHLLKVQRTPTLRAPHSTKPGKAAGAGR